MMISKIVTFMVGFVVAWVGIVMMAECYVVPGVLVMGVGVSVVRTILEIE